MNPLDAAICAATITATLILTLAHHLGNRNPKPPPKPHTTPTNSHGCQTNRHKHWMTWDTEGNYHCDICTHQENEYA